MKEQYNGTMFFIGQQVKVIHNGFHVQQYGHIVVGDIKTIKNFDSPIGRKMVNGVTFTDGSGGHCSGPYTDYLKPLPPERVVNHEVWYN